jgi:glycerate 2-kinase
LPETAHLATAGAAPRVRAAGRSLTVLVAPDSFTGSLTALEAANAMAAGLLDAATRTAVDLEVRSLPVADGGEGTVDVLVAAGWTRAERTVTGPTGLPVQAAFALSPADRSPRTAVVELAQASGLLRLPDRQPDPLNAGTTGTGELVAAALDEGSQRIVIGLGGSASTDGGTGLVTALGVRLLDATGRHLEPGGAALRELDRIDISGIDPRLASTQIVVACDVDNPLTGPRGAAHVFGPQKGASPEDVAVLDTGLARLAEVLRRDLGVDVEQTPGAGAAGGTGGGALAFLDPRLTPGIDLVLDLLDFDAALAGADLLVTGEGSFDSQSLSGKAPVGAARRAHAAGVPVVVLAGRFVLDADGESMLRDLGVIDVRALLDIEPDETRARSEAAALLRELAARALTDHHSVVGSPT